ncbi:MAG: hypothetical protein EHM61_22345 [Acidobacteria bacterium]|nr:MAG: hypothetical protein EHM61_22345 [Acidobacteriota bacterium]
MAGKPRVHGRKSLIRYEWLNLVLLMFAVVVLTLFSSWVFQYYSKPDTELDGEASILSEVVTDADVCMFTVGTRLTHTSRRYQSPLDITPNDTLAKNLFGIGGIVEVSIHEKSVVLRKIPSVRWETIQPAARGIITDYMRNN